MRVPILMPQLGESIAEATIKAVNVEQGDSVNADQEIIEVETEKAVMEVTSPCEGCVVEISARVNISYPVGTVLGFLEISAEEADRMGVTPGEKAQESSSENAIPQQVTESSSANSAKTSKDTANQTENAQVSPTIPGLPVPAKAKGATYISPRLRARMQELGLNAAPPAVLLWRILKPSWVPSKRKRPLPLLQCVLLWPIPCVAAGPAHWQLLAPRSASTSCSATGKTVTQNPDRHSMQYVP